FDARLTWSPLVLLPVFLLIGAVVGFLFEPGVVQRLVLMVCALSALGLLTAQIVLGFPLAQTILEMLLSETDMRFNPPSSAGFKYTFWFGLAFCAVLASAITAGAQ